MVLDQNEVPAAVSLRRVVSGLAGTKVCWTRGPSRRCAVVMGRARVARRKQVAAGLWEGTLSCRAI